MATLEPPAPNAGGGVASAPPQPPADLPHVSRSRRLEYLPVALFGSVMGLSGLSVAWRLAAGRYGAPIVASEVIALLAVLTFATLVAAYTVKAVTASDAVIAEFRHPVAGNLFGTMLISLLLLPILIAPVAIRVAQVMWVVGAGGMLAFAWAIVDRWMGERQQVEHATPAWIVPVVGLLDVPLAVPGLGLPIAHGLMIPCLAIGLFFAIPLFTLVFSRLVFQPPMPTALQPTLLILVAPFAVGFSAYVATTGMVDRFAEALYALMLFMLTILIGKLRAVRRSCPFHISWWAVSFPLAASAAAAIRFAGAVPGAFPDTVAWILLVVATAVIAWLAIRTILGVARGELRTLST